MSVLVIAEVQHRAITPGTYATISAALKLKGSCDVLLLGHNIQEHAQVIAKTKGVQKVLVADQPSYEHALAENVAPCIAELSASYQHVLAPSSTTGKNIMPRVAALRDVMLIADVTKIINETTFERPIYAGNAIATYQSKDSQVFLTVRPTAFEPQGSGEELAILEPIDLVFETNKVMYLKSEIPELERPELTSAKIVVSGGRGLQSKENFQMIERLADLLGAAIGASRAAVDAGFVPNDYQVGQTGKIVAPDLYVAVGISGAIQHLAGIKDSKIIVAINKDPDAPIFQVADYGLVGDLFAILPELEKQLA